MTKDELTAALAEKDAEIEQRRTEVGELRARCEALEAESRRGAEIIRDLEEGASRVNARIAELETEVDAKRELSVHLDGEISRLASFLLEHYSDQITEGGAVDVAIRLLELDEAETGETLAPAILLRSLLADHLELHGVADPQAEAGNVIAHLADFARHTTRLPENVVRALMALP